MARPRKDTKKATSPSEENKELSVEQVWDVMKFTEQLYRGVYNPMLVNAAMQNVTMNPQAANEQRINEALLDPKNNEQNLIGFSEYEELVSVLYKRILYYFGGLLEFNWSYTCMNAKPEDYSGEAYKKDLKKVEEFFDKFNPKQEFRNVIKQLMRQEAHFSIFRTDGNYRHTIQELPQNQSIITGRWEMGILFDFNMMFFLNNPGVDIDMFPPVFKKLYNRAFGNKNPESYNPGANINMRDGSWTYYVQTSPKDNFWCFKLVPEIATRVPMFAGYLKDIVSQDLIRALQQDSYIADATKLLVGAVPFLKDTKASVKDSLALDPTTLAKFLQLMKSGLSNAIKVVAAPLENINGVSFDGSKDIYDSYLKTTASASGINSRLLFSYDRANILETRLSMDVDMNILRPVLTQFENFLEFFVNQKTKKFKFKFHVHGFNTSLDREERLKTANDYAERGMIMDQMFASALSMNPFDFRRQLAETKANGFVKKLTPILKASQTPGGDQPNGRPAKADSELGDSGEQTRSDGENLE